MMLGILTPASFNRYVPFVPVLVATAWAGDDDDRGEWEREKAERAREQAERLRELAKERAQMAAEQMRRAAATQQKASAPAKPVTSSTTSPSNTSVQKPASTASPSSNGSSSSKTTTASKETSSDKKSAQKSKEEDDFSKDKDDDSNDKSSAKKNDKDDGRDDVSIAAGADDPPPATLKDLFQKWTSSGSSGQGKSEDVGKREKGLETGTLPGTVGYSDGSKSEQGRGKRDDGDKTAGGDTDGSGPVSKPPVAGDVQKAAGSHVPQRGRPDFELLTLGNFKPREIMAANLNAAAAERAKSLGFKPGGALHAPGQSGDVRRLVIPPGLTEGKALALLREMLPDAAFGPNHVYHITPAADDGVNGKNTKVAALDEKSAVPCAGDHCFARELIGWKPQLKSCARSVKVGLIDTSFDVAHPAFAGRKMKLGKFAGEGAPSTSDWHGTAVLSVLAGDTTSATPGLVPDAQFLLASTFSSDKDGSAVADSLAVLKALSWLDAEKADVVNMSFSGPANELIEAAISAMAEKGVIFVAAAGNRGVSGPASYPAAYDQVIAVTAVGKNKQNYRHANRGEYVDVSAPGIDVWAALPGGKQGYRTGTSFAAPFVTGLLAAMPAARKNIADKRDVLSRVTFQDLGEPGRDPVYGEGLPIAPKTCNEVGGIASLPWSQEAKRMSVGGPKPQAAAPAIIPATLVRPAGR